jgi:hypothetical protein
VPLRSPVIAAGPFTFERERYERALVEASYLLDALEWSGWMPYEYEPERDRDDGAASPEAAAMTGYTPEAQTHVLAVAYVDDDSALVAIDTVPSHPMQVSCARAGEEWFELSASG